MATLQGVTAVRDLSDEQLDELINALYAAVQVVATPIALEELDGYCLKATGEEIVRADLEVLQQASTR